uniref:Spliceosome-associated protein CWC27 homolog n=2 Tax=Sinocyclocheilus anshuiensis TaxID=1608454 RepID=A0A671NW26_9TELE
MSNIYIQEPPTNGKVLLKTSAGDIDIELWSKEAPKACRNFTQLCMEGRWRHTVRYAEVNADKTKHFRIMHGNVCLLCFWLQVTGDTVYNILRLAEVACDRDERPLNPHKIRSTEVLHSPFDDIIPRELKVKKEKNKEEGKKSQSKATKNFSLLSFGEEAEEDEEMVSKVSQTMKGKSKSSHDLLKDDPKLSSVPVIDRNQGDDFEDASDDSEDESDRESERERIRENISQKLKRDKADEQKTNPDTVKKTSRSDELRKEARQLKKEILAIKQRKEDGVKKEEDVSEGDSKPTSEAVTEYLESRKKYEDKRKQKLKKGSGREAQTLALLEHFKSKLSSAISETPSVPEEAVEELGEDDDKGWMAHVLHFDEQTRKVKDANMQDEDTFEIYDPRNPVNKRRREESKKLMKEKKARR